MAGSITLRFEGGAEIARKLNALPAKVSRQAQLDALKAAAEPIRAEMQANAPVDIASRHQDQLYESMNISTVRASGDQSAEIAVGPSKRAFWGLFQEYGTARHSAQPFARPAFDRHRGTALTLIRQRLWDALRKGLPSDPGSVGGRFE